MEIPFYGSVGRQRGRGFGALAQVIGRTAISYLLKYIVPAAESVSADLLELVATKLAEVFSDTKKFKTAAKRLGKQFLRQYLGSGGRKRTASSVIPSKSAI